MKRIGAILSVAAALTAVAAAPAWADGFRSYRVCGGDQFVTCAAVEINVVGTSATVRMWNLSGNFAATSTASSGSTVFNSIGFYNLPAGVSAVTGSLTMSGPARPGDTPAPWQLRNDSRVNFIVDMAATNGGSTANGIASGCANPASLPAGDQLFLNPCADPTSDPTGWVTLNFQISGGSWDPGATDVVIRGKNARGAVTECWTNSTPGGLPANCGGAVAAPEPVTMTLLATGLASMGGAGFIRRRRNRNEVV